MIRIDLAQLGFPYHMTNAGLGPDLNLHISTLTQILQNVNRSALPESIVLHRPAPLLVDTQDVYTLLSPSPHSWCAVVFFHNRIAEVLGLLKYVASTARSQPHGGLQWYGPQSTQVG